MIAIAMRDGFHRFEWMHARADGSEFLVEISLTPITVGSEVVLFTLWRDITERKQAERFEQFRSRVLELLAGDQPLSVILEAIVRGLEQLDSAMLCTILLLDKDRMHLKTGAAPSLSDFYNRAIESVEIGVGVGSCGTAAITGNRVIVDDIASYPYWAPFKELAARAALSAPYLLTISKNGKTDIVVEHRCTVSIGVEVFINHEVNQDDILKWADATMYLAKEQGRNIICFFEGEI